MAICDEITRDAALFPDFPKPVGVRTVRRPDDENHVDQLRQGLDRILTILRGVTDVFLMRPLDVGEPMMQRLDDIAAFIERAGGLVPASAA